MRSMEKETIFTNVATTAEGVRRSDVMRLKRMSRNHESGVSVYADPPISRHVLLRSPLKKSGFVRNERVNYDRNDLCTA